MTDRTTTRPSVQLYPDDRRREALRLGARNGSGVGQDRHNIDSGDSPGIWWIVAACIVFTLVARVFL